MDADEINVTSKMTDIWPTPSGAMEKLGYFPNANDPNVYRPNIDALADQGMLFINFYVNGTVCSSSRYNIIG